jgi:superfamily II DNA/RNA helicase
MLDMGFEPQIQKILQHVPRSRHTMFFTATWPREAGEFFTEMEGSVAACCAMLLETRETRSMETKEILTHTMHSTSFKPKKNGKRRFGIETY